MQEICRFLIVLQLSRHWRDNLLSAFSTLIAKNFAIDALVYVPIHHSL